jgi:prepilin-type processing-associated H-X9-DG protein
MGMPGIGFPGGMPGMPGMAPAWQQASASKGGNNTLLYLLIGAGGLAVVVSLVLVVVFSLTGDKQRLADATPSGTPTAAAGGSTTTPAGTTPTTTPAAGSTTTTPAAGATAAAATTTPVAATAATGDAAAAPQPTPTPRTRPTEFVLAPGKPMWVEGTLLNGTPIDWSSYGGKVVLVDFWASWCGPCLAELPNVRQVYDKYHAQGFEVIGISLDETRQELNTFLASNPVPWPVMFSANQQDWSWNHPMARLYKIEAIPAAVLVNKEGNIVSTSARGPDLGRLVGEQLGAAAGTLAVGAPKLDVLYANLGQWRDKGQPMRGARHFTGMRFAAGYSWMVELLPFLGRQNIYDQFKFEDTWLKDERAIPLSYEVIVEFLNPADDKVRWVETNSPWENMALTHYVGMSGIEQERNAVAALLARTHSDAGIFGYDEIAKLDMVSDGTSQTILMLGAGTLSAPWLHGGGATIRGAREPYFDELAGFGSKGVEGGGVHVLFADGSVRVISKDIDPAVFRALCTMHGGETAIELSTVPAVKEPTW